MAAVPFSASSIFRSPYCFRTACDFVEMKWTMDNAASTCELISMEISSDDDKVPPMRIRDIKSPVASFHANGINQYSERLDLNTDR